MITSSSSWETTYLSFLTLIIPHEMACTWKIVTYKEFPLMWKINCVKDYLLPRFEMLSTHFEHLKTQFESQSSKFLRIEFLGTVTLLLSILTTCLKTYSNFSYIAHHFFCSWIKKQVDIGGIERNYEIALLMLKEGTHTLNVQQCCFKRYTCHFELL